MIVGSGVDVVEIERIARAWARGGERFERRIYTPAEIALCRRHARPEVHFALRFAAKEAGMKAVGTGWARGVRWVDFETDGSAEQLRLGLRGRAAEIAGELAGGPAGAAPVAHLAVGRSRSHAMAVVVLEGGGR